MIELILKYSIFNVNVVSHFNIYVISAILSYFFFNYDL